MNRLHGMAFDFTSVTYCRAQSENQVKVEDAQETYFVRRLRFVIV